MTWQQETLAYASVMVLWFWPLAAASLFAALEIPQWLHSRHHASAPLAPGVARAASGR